MVRHSLMFVSWLKEYNIECVHIMPFIIYTVIYTHLYIIVIQLAGSRCLVMEFSCSPTALIFKRMVFHSVQRPELRNCPCVHVFPMMPFSVSFCQIVWYRQGELEPKFRNLIYYMLCSIVLLCICANLYFHDVGRDQQSNALWQRHGLFHSGGEFKTRQVDRNATL